MPDTEKKPDKPKEESKKSKIPQPKTTRSYIIEETEKININKASVQELVKLKNVGLFL